MANSKLIVVEGAQGAGKTTITDFLRYSIPYTNLYRLNGTADSTATGLPKATKMYENLINYIQTLENQSINLVFDRTFFTEENYCRQGFKEYSFTEVYNKLLEKFSKLDFEIYYITLYLENEDLFVERIKRDKKCAPSYAQFKADSSINQQKIYLEMAKEISEKYPNIHTLDLANDQDLDRSKQILKDFIGF